MTDLDRLLELRDELNDLSRVQENMKGKLDKYNFLKAKIEGKINHGEQFLKQKYHYQTNFEAAAKVFNDLTEEEYDKYASGFAIMTWIANELADQNMVEVIKKWHKTTSANHNSGTLYHGLDDILNNMWSNTENE